MSDDLLSNAKEEVVGMAKQGMKHPSTKPVLAGAAAGGVAGALLSGLSIPVGVLVGAGVMLFMRIRR